MIPFGRAETIFQLCGIDCRLRRICTMVLWGRFCVFGLREHNVCSDLQISQFCYCRAGKNCPNRKKGKVCTKKEKK